MRSIFVTTFVSFLIIQLLIRPLVSDTTLLVPGVLPPKQLVHFTFGYHDSAADSLWVRVIQNFGFCKNDMEKENYHDLTRSGDAHFDEILGEKKAARCNRGWVFQMLDRITDLSPRFLMAYTMGASTLSIIVDDDEGASLLYAKGVKVFPHHWSLAYRAAYHELYEMKNFKKAANYLFISGQNGAPLWVQNLASKLYERSGQILLGRAALIDLIRRSKDSPKLQEKAMVRLRQLNKLSSVNKADERNKTKQFK